MDGHAWEKKQACFVLFGKAIGIREVPVANHAVFLNEDETGLFRLPGTCAKWAFHIRVFTTNVTTLSGCI